MLVAYTETILATSVRVDAKLLHRFLHRRKVKDELSFANSHKMVLANTVLGLVNDRKTSFSLKWLYYFKYRMLELPWYIHKAPFVHLLI